MRIAVTGASSVLGRSVVARLVRQGHDVVGLSRQRAESWSGSVEFVEGDVRDVVAVSRVIGGADVVAHFAWARSSGAVDSPSYEVNIGGTANVLAAMAKTGARRIVFASSAHVYGSHVAGTSLSESAPSNPRTAEGRQKACVEHMLAASNVEWVAVRAAHIVGRSADNRMRRMLASPVFFDLNRAVGRSLQVIHLDDALEMFLRAMVDGSIGSGPVNLAAPGELTLGDVMAILRRPVVPLNKKLLCVASHVALKREAVDAWLSALELLENAALMNTALLRDQWAFTPVWNSTECINDLALAVRGRITVGKKLISLPWRVAYVQDVPRVDAPAPDGVIPQLVGPEGGNGEFDTPIDPRFPTFVATNLSEALPGPFSPSSASVSVRGMRAGGVAIAERLRPGGLIQREIATRTVGVFGHRLYLAITSSYFMAETVPFVKPMTVLRQFFGQRVVGLPIFGPRPPVQAVSLARRSLLTLRSVGVFGVNLVSLTLGAARDTDDFIADVGRLERLAGDDVTRLDDRRLLSLILLGRDYVVHGWVLVSASIMLCNAFNVIMRGLCGRDTPTPAGPGLVSMHLLDALGRLVVAARRDPEVTRLLAEPDIDLDILSTRVQEFHAAVFAELALIGHRGPGEVEMQSTTYSDVPELLIRMVAKSLDSAPAPQVRQSPIPLRARAVARLSAHHVRDRELRRDRTVRANWVLRRLLREHGRRLTNTGVLGSPDDVFYLLVDELAALPSQLSDLVASRRAEQSRLAAIDPPAGFSGGWQVARPVTTVTPGETLYGLGVSTGRARGRVRIVTAQTLDDLQPGEILVAEVTDVGYTAAFSYAAAVITDLGGLMSHAAIVAREFGIPCVVDAHCATRRLPPNALVELDGATGEIRVLDLATNTKPLGHAPDANGITQQ